MVAERSSAPPRHRAMRVGLSSSCSIQPTDDLLPGQIYVAHLAVLICTLFRRENPATLVMNRSQEENRGLLFFSSLAGLWGKIVCSKSKFR